MPNRSSGFAIGLVTAQVLCGCSLVTVERDFPPMQIRAERAAPPPPRVVLTDSHIEILEKVQFELGSAKLLAVSFPLLDEVARVLADNPQILVIEIEGHTDSTGGAARNRELSRERADSVREYLIGRGIAKDRMAAKGYGPDRPIAGNDTPEGREANRRVQFKIARQDKKKILIEED
jgi:OmpA-OmpF porin, OOP family